MRATLVILAAALLLAVVSLTIGTGVVAQPPKSDAPAGRVNPLSADDEKALRQVIRGFEEAWNTHDMKAFAKLLRDDVEWVNIVGMHWKGRDAVVAAHEAFHKTANNWCQFIFA
jgi:hypothetical protein